MKTQCCILLLAQGIIGSGVSITLITWCVRMRGPLFVSVFNPLMLVLVALAGSMILDEKLHLGRYAHISVHFSVSYTENATAGLINQ